MSRRSDAVPGVPGEAHHAVVRRDEDVAPRLSGRRLPGPRVCEVRLCSADPTHATRVVRDACEGAAGVAGRRGRPESTVVRGRSGANQRARRVRMSRMATRETTIVSTRSNASEGVRRDFDGFDVDEELSRFREALRRGQWRVAAELASNLDESICRGGSLPVAWLGPPCMQDPDDLKTRHEETLENAAKMSSQQRQDAVWGYVEVPRGTCDA